MRYLTTKNPDWNKGNELKDITYKPPYKLDNKPLEKSGIIGNVYIIKQK